MVYIILSERISFYLITQLRVQQIIFECFLHYLFVIQKFIYFCKWIALACAPGPRHYNGGRDTRRRDRLARHQRRLNRPRARASGSAVRLKAQLYGFISLLVNEAPKIICDMRQCRGVQLKGGVTTVFHARMVVADPAHSH